MKNKMASLWFAEGVLHDPLIGTGLAPHYKKSHDCGQKINVD